MRLVLTPVLSQVIKHRLTAETLGGVAADTFAEEGSDVLREAIASVVDHAAAKLLARLDDSGLDVENPVEAWCVADCVEGSTWSSCEEKNGNWAYLRAVKEEESLRTTLNGSSKFIAFLGRCVEGPMAVCRESDVVKNAIIAALAVPFLKPGDVVNVFEKPITDEKLEGTARLVEFLFGCENDRERWIVDFDVDRNRGGDKVEREVKPKNRVDGLTYPASTK